jgi:hypothetical protein
LRVENGELESGDIIAIFRNEESSMVFPEFTKAFACLAGINAASVRLKRLIARICLQPEMKSAKVPACPLISRLQR